MHEDLLEVLNAAATETSVIVPSKDLIVVRLGRFDDRVGFKAAGEWIDRVVMLFPDVR